MRRSGKQDGTGGEGDREEMGWEEDRIGLDWIGKRLREENEGRGGGS